MDIVILGAAAIVLIAITLWIVWPSRPLEATSTAGQEGSRMIQQGDSFEDQYTSATGDLSAGGIAVTEYGQTAEGAASAEAPSSVESVTPSAYQSAGEPWSEPTTAREGTAASAPTYPMGVRRDRPALASGATLALPEGRHAEERRQPSVGFGAAAILALASGVGGAWLYARWQRQREKPLNRLRRRLFR